MEVSYRKKWVLGLFVSSVLLTLVLGFIKFLEYRQIYRLSVLSTSDYFADIHRDFIYNIDLTIQSDIVVRGLIAKPDTTVQASSDQNEVAYEQGWKVSRVKVKEVLSGGGATDEILISPNGWCSTPMVGHSFIEPFLEGQEFLFFLKRDDKLTRWTKTDVYSTLDLIPLNAIEVAR